MAVLLKWKNPSDESNYNKVYIYRADSENGTYSEITNLYICDDTYYDYEGTTSSWYKIRFYSSVLAQFSSYSDPMQGGDFYAYCSIEDIREITNISQDQISDTALAKFLKFACTQVNNDIKIEVKEELAERIDNWRLNTINGINKTFYTKNRYLGDKNDDFVVNSSDVIAYTINSSGERTEYTVSSVDAFLGKVELESAPTTSETLYFNYVYVKRRVDQVDSIVRYASVLCTAMWCYRKLNTGKATRFHMGNLTVSRDMDSPKYYRLLYYEEISKINASTIVNITETDLVI